MVHLATGNPERVEINRSEQVYPLCMLYIARQMLHEVKKSSADLAEIYVHVPYDNNGDF